MRSIKAVAIKELHQIVRDRRTLGILLLFPAFILLIYGYALNFDIRDVRLAVQDQDRSTESRALVSAFVNSGYFQLVGYQDSDAALDALVDRNQARALLVVPTRFGEDIRTRRPATVQVIIDGDNANTAATVVGYAQALVAEYSTAVRLAALRRVGMEESAGAVRSAETAESAGSVRSAETAESAGSVRSAGTAESAGSVRSAGTAESAGSVRSAGTSVPASSGITLEPRIWYNPQLRSTLFLVPGLIAFIAMVTAVVSTALSVVKEKERGTMEQIRMSPISPLSFILGKTTPYLVLSFFSALLILFTARLLFDLPMRGSWWLLCGSILLFLIGAQAQGLLISTIATSQQVAFQVALLSSFLPTFILSGFIFPLSSMPIPIQVISHIVPARYFLVALRGIVLKGAGLEAFWEQLVWLAVFSTVALGLASLRLRREWR